MSSPRRRGPIRRAQVSWFSPVVANSPRNGLWVAACAGTTELGYERGMGDVYGIVKVAAVQAASVFLDREGSTEKACRLIREAGRNGARVIGFPEGFIPAHPVWYHHHSATGALSNRLAVELFKNAVEIPGPQTDALGRAAR